MKSKGSGSAISVSTPPAAGAEAKARQLTRTTCDMSTPRVSGVARSIIAACAMGAAPAIRPDSSRPARSKPIGIVWAPRAIRL